MPMDNTQLNGTLCSTVYSESTAIGAEHGD